MSASGSQKLVWIAAAALLVSGLSSSAAKVATAREIQPTHAAWQAAVRARGVDPLKIADPLEFTAEMRARAAEIADARSALDRLLQLQRYLYSEQSFEFTYYSEATLTAREAFETGVGNCVSSTNLFIAMGRSLGIPVQPALVLSRRRTEMDGDLLIINKHIVAAYRKVGQTALFDFSSERERVVIGFLIIDDLWNTGVYLNNQGARALRDGELDKAEQYLEAAVRLAPRFVAAYGNLGVIRRRQGDLEGALAAYINGLRIDGNDTTIWNNVRGLLREPTLERIAAAGWSEEEIPATAEGLVARGDLRLVRMDRHAAKRIYKDARRHFPDSLEPKVALARLLLFEGRLSAAQNLLTAAAKIDPHHSELSLLQKVLARVRREELLD